MYDANFVSNTKTMTHTYLVTGMTCGGCEKTVKALLGELPAVQEVSIDRATGIVSIRMQQHIPTSELKQALKDYPQYQLSENTVMQH